MRKLKTERYEIRVTPGERELYRKAGELFVSAESSTAGTADVVRDSALITSENLLKIQAGEYTLMDAMENYKSFLVEMMSVVPGVFPVSDDEQKPDEKKADDKESGE